MIFKLGVLMLGLFLLSGCGGGGATVTDLTGQWSRAVNVPGSSMRMNLTMKGPSVTGSGTYSIEAGRSGTFGVTGSAIGSGFSLVFSYDTGDMATYQGTETASSQLQGTVHQQGMTDYSLAMTRQ